MTNEHKFSKIGCRSLPRLLALCASVIVFFGIFFFPSLAGLDQNLYSHGQRPSASLNIVVDGAIGPPSSFGLEKMSAALQEKGFSLVRKGSLREAPSSDVILIGTLKGSSAIRDLQKKGTLALKNTKESLSVKRLNEGGKNLLVVAGTDDRGLMYALLEIARQVPFLTPGAPVLDAIKETSESPASPVRSMVVFLHNQDDERDWYYSKDYWLEYFGMLAADRWNTFNLVFSHQTPYLAPMYPFHVKVDQYPEVKAKGLSDEQREKNLEMLRFISSLAKDRGLDFTLSIWQQIAWEKESPGRGQESMVTGYNRQNMTDYTYRALTKLLRECPGITGVQLRLNYESGINFDEQTAFFRDGVFRAAREAGRPILIEIRDIGLLRETLDAALATGLPVRVSHKYWGEHMSFPYHPAKFIWTYSYGDWLKYPRQADQIYQVWSLGSHRLLLWGDPEFAARFAPTTTFEDSAGFEICAPIPQKGFGNAPGAWRIFRSREREYYQWEFQRYWSYYLLFGRLTYNPATADEVWTSELGRRFGAEAGAAIARAYRSASQVVSLIAGYSTCNYNMGTWPEKDMGGLINYYLNLMPYDQARFRSFRESVEDRLAGRGSGRLSPEDVATRLDAIASATEKSLDQARPLVRGSEKEFWATDMDFRILSGMARYHAQKIRAAMRLGFFYRTGDIGQIRQAIRYAETALATWKDLSARADEIYSSNLVFGPGSVGHWKDNIRFVEDDLKQLKYQDELFQLTQNADFPFDFGPEPLTATTEAWSTVYTDHYMVEPRFRGVSPSSRFDPATGFGWIEARDLKADPARNVSGNVWQGANKNAGPPPGDALLGDFIQGSQPAVFRIDLPEGHYQGTVIITDKRAKAVDHGPMTVSVVERFGDRPIVEREIVKVGQTLIKRFNFNMVGERFTTFRLKFSADAGADYIVNAVMFTRVEPHIAHVPLLTARPGQEVNLTASVTLPPPPNDEHPLTSLGIITSNASTLEVPRGLARVTLKYAVDPNGASRSVDMQMAEAAAYSAALPAAEVKTGKIRYYFEAEDSTGRTVRLPRENAKQPYYQIDVTDDQAAPQIAHNPIAEHTPGQPLEIRASVTDASAIDKVLLYYRPTRQTMEYSVVTMERRGGEYFATIPGKAISAEFDLMYYFEAFDEHGNACLYPSPDVTQPYLVVKVRRGAAGPTAPRGK
jgi:hypothetical protein